ncbi:MAG: hypothetical protein N4A57_12470 [Anaeromicrobium sp.]|jgi:hypothetical protein|nr:helix-turn-helix domain-containing protein [Anaeromicrobium sp.]MCT4595065.1 hypothetical protein [Anaeromicrobium sp.]
MGNRVDFGDYYRFLEKHIKKYSYINGKLDEDLYQQLAIKVYKCFHIVC